MTTLSWMRPAIFGAVDGLTCALGVILSLAGHTGFILPGAIGVGTAEMFGMTMGEWMSESKNGFLPSLVMGLTTGLAAVLPAVPYSLCAGATAVVLSVLVFLSATVLIACVRASERGWKRSFLESFSVIGSVAVGVYVSHLLTPNPGG